MNRSAPRTIAALAAVAIVGAACSSADGPNPTTETTEPVPVEPNQEPEAGLTEAPVGEGAGTDG